MLKLNTIQLRARHHVQAFTLMEALISIAIMLMAVVAAMSLTTQSIKLISATRERMLASMLVRESMELIRNQRDANFLRMIQIATGESGANNYSWLDHLRTPDGDKPCFGSNSDAGKGCVVQIDPVPITKDSAKLTTFGKCGDITSEDKQSRCWVLTNGGETLNANDRETILKDLCTDSGPVGSLAYNQCISAGLDDAFLQLFRQLKYDAGGLKGRTQYRRVSTVEISASGDCKEMVIVTTKITWPGRFGVRQVLTEDHLYNWIGNGILALTDDRCQ